MLQNVSNLYVYQKENSNGNTGYSLFFPTDYMGAPLWTWLTSVLWMKWFAENGLRTQCIFQENYQLYLSYR